MIRISFMHAAPRATRRRAGVALTVTSCIMALQLRNRSRVALSQTLLVYITLKMFPAGELPPRRDVIAAHNVLRSSVVLADHRPDCRMAGGWSVNTPSTALL